MNKVLSGELAQVGARRARPPPGPPSDLRERRASVTDLAQLQADRNVGDESGRSSREKRVRNYESVAFTTCQRPPRSLQNNESVSVVCAWAGATVRTYEVYAEITTVSKILNV